jgi:hypothetical protein
VRGLTDLAAKAADRLRDALHEARRAPGGWPAEGATVLLVASGADRRAPGLRVVPESDQVEVRAPAGRAVVGWLRERARAAGVDLAPDAAQALVELVGEDLTRLAAEIEKASLYAAGERRVSEEDVRALAGETRTRQYWELTQALEEGRRADALRLASQLLGAGDEPLILLAWIVGYLRDLWRVLPAATAGAELREVARALHRGPDRRAHGRIAHAALLTLPDPLHRGLGVGHRITSPVRDWRESSGLHRDGPADGAISERTVRHGGCQGSRPRGSGSVDRSASTVTLRHHRPRPR